MSYLFPRRVLRAQDVLDPIELTQDISPAAERLSGHLNAHNLNQSIASTVAVQPDAFYAVQHYEYDQFFYWDGTNPNWGNPDLNWAPGLAYQVQNNFEWNVITEPVSFNSDPAQVTISTGNSVLWINAYAQYLWYGFDDPPTTTWFPTPRDQHAHGAMTTPANLQFAIRVDGNIVPETITGIDDMTYRASLPIRQTVQRTASSILPGPADIRGSQIVALGPPVLPVRISAMVPVQAGEHTVELVVRRVPVINGDSIKAYKSTDKIYVFGRQVNAIDLKSFPTDSVGGSEVSAPAWDEEDPVTSASIYTARVQPIITRSNAVQEGNLARGALMHYHLPSALLGAYSVEVAFTGELFNNTMPGQGVTTTTTTRYAGAPANGWTLVSDGGASPTGGTLLLTGIPATVDQKRLVLANVQVRNLRGGVDASVDADGNPNRRGASIRSFALFRLMWRRSAFAAWTAVNESDGMVNSFVWWPSDPSTSTSPVLRVPLQAYGLEQVEVPLMALITVPAGTPVQVGMFCGTSGQSEGTDTEFEIRHGNIVVLALRA